MNYARSSGTADHSLLADLGERLLGDWAENRGRSGRDAAALLVFNPAAPGPETGSRALNDSNLLLTLEGAEGARQIECRGRAVVSTEANALPLQSESLDLVVLSHLIARGDEALLAESCRMLRPGGTLLILGLNRQGWRFRRPKRSTALPGIHALSVRERLEELDMKLETTYANGFLGGDRPRRLDRGLGRLLIPVADVLLIVARPAEPPVMNPLAESRKMRAVGAPSALAGR